MLVYPFCVCGCLCTIKCVCLCAFLSDLFYHPECFIYCKAITTHAHTQRDAHRVQETFTRGCGAVKAERQSAQSVLLVSLFSLVARHFLLLVPLSLSLSLWVTAVQHTHTHTHRCWLHIRRHTHSQNCAYTYVQLVLLLMNESEYV